MHDNHEITKLKTVNALVSNEAEKLDSDISTIKQKVLSARADMSLETARVAGNLLDPDNFENFINFAQYSEEIGLQEQDFKTTINRLAQLVRMKNSPYFARIDFVEHGYDDTEEIYIGRYSLLDGETYAVYDWRAPISSLYYDHGIGTAVFKVPFAGGADGAGENEIKGEITVKRQYEIEKGELKFFFDTDLAIGDEILRLELSKTSDAKMKTIINSIQKEQNQAIRAAHNHVLITGPAGSGKTSVGLHRLAYLLYKNRKNLNSGRVRIFSPSPFFASYISGIIPELGEDDIETLDFPGLMWSYSQRDRKFNDQYEQIDFIMQASPDDPRLRWIKQKYSSEFIAFLEDFILNYAPTFSEDIMFNTDVVCEKSRLTELYATRTASSTLAVKIGRVMTYVERAYSEYFAENQKKITLLFEDLHDDAYFTKNEVRAYFEKEKAIVIADLTRKLMPSSVRLYDKILRAWAKRQNLPISYAAAAIKQETLTFEDSLVLFYIDICAGWVKQEQVVRHILLDEAQDMSVLHHAILRRLFPASNFTVLADVNQALFADINLHSLADLQEMYPAAIHNPLTKSYRNTYEISRFAANILGENALPGDESSYQRHGDEPKIIKTDDAAAAALEILRGLEGCSTVGILLDTREAAADFYEKLRGVYPANTNAESDMNGATTELPPLHHIATADDDFRLGVMIMATPLAKGLEFDAVICPQYADLSKASDETSRKILYLICTRALHKLFLLEA